jgi:hypothetical protein
MSPRNLPFDRIKNHLRIGKPSRLSTQIFSSGSSEHAAEKPEVVEQPAILAEENLLASPQPPKTGPAPDDKSPIWSQSMQHFAQVQPALYKLIQDRIGEIGEVVDVDNWDTWMNRRPEDKRNEWLRRCKAYLPRFKTVKTLATSLSNLDPHHLAPYVTTGVFVFIEVSPNASLTT